MLLHRHTQKLVCHTDHIQFNMLRNAPRNKQEPRRNPSKTATVIGAGAYFDTDKRARKLLMVLLINQVPLHKISGFLSFNFIKLMTGAVGILEQQTLL